MVSMESSNAVVSRVFVVLTEVVSGRKKELLLFIMMCE